MNVKETRDLIADQEPIICLIRRCMVREGLYPEHSQTVDTSALKESLVQLYEKILHYQVASYHYMTRNVLKRAIKSLVPSTIVVIGEEIEEKEKQVEDEIALIWQQDSQARLNALQGSLLKIGGRLGMLERDERIRILDWISRDLPYGENTRLAASQPQEGTCKWIVDTPEYKQWRSCQTATLLGLQGKMGAGKTFLTSAVIRDIQHRQSSSARERLAFFFCEGNKSHTAGSVINSMLRQLLASNPLEPLPPEVVDTYNNKAPLRTEIGVEDAISNIIAMANNNNSGISISLVVDALDELDDKERRRLHADLRTVMAESAVKIMVSGRELDDLPARLPGPRLPGGDSDYLIVRIDSQNSTDIFRYVDSRLDAIFEPIGLDDTVHGRLLPRSAGAVHHAVSEPKPVPTS
ncbi:hypothetical protein B0T16DRAFT_71870 [Cercophora newfieldiana]|uniref:Nephrocystin 3-like N-terminal domain-containing protein n=1 Tax=Cercophora newfieldiana TaxID=92897 RepID=A0AA39YT17_9PEZI|nr:hypothetical protein B0T16DRAFT_71870 [Cercophora newfieldiana]